jgi:hypothetical protein
MKFPADGQAAYPSEEHGGILATPPWCVRQLAMSLSRFALPWGLQVETGVHVRLTESLKVSCNLHLELSGSRAKPTAALRGVIFLTAAPLNMARIAVNSRRQSQRHLLATAPSPIMSSRPS